MAEVLVSPGISVTETDMSAIAARPIVAGAALIGPTAKGQVNIPTKVTSYGDYVRRFGTTFKVEKSGSIQEQEFMTSMAAKSYFEQGGESLLVVRVASSTFTKADSTTILNNTTASLGEVFKLHTLSTGKALNNVSGSTYREYEEGTGSYDERKDGSLISGSAENIRFEISNVNEDAGTFSLTIRRGDDTDLDKIVLESFTNLSLDPNSANYIAAVIGDQYQVVREDEAEKYVDVIGNYTNKSAYVYVEVIKPTLNYHLADGYTVASDSNGLSYKCYLPREQKGGFLNGTGVVGEVTGVESPSIAYYDEITKDTVYPQAVKPADYATAISILRNQDEYQINIISAPGLLGKDSQAQIDNLVSLASERGDCIAVVDLSYAADSTNAAAEAASNVNNSYAATYFPWLQMYNSCGRLVWVPASVVIPGVYAYSDKQSAPWFAPAGMKRGGIQGVTQTRKKLTKAQRDTLYAKNVNPIATFPGSGIVIYGQKTLQKKASALDRVNARRLLIELKKKVKDMASGLLFEQNSASTRNSFRAKLEPYLESVVERQGLYAYKVVIDELNDADTIDRNEFRCQIYIQPTKVIEFVYIDFTITATGVEFNS